MVRQELRNQKELIKMRESLSDWRSELVESGEHPYVDIMPMVLPKKSKKKDEEKKEEEPKEEKEEVKEEV